MDLHPLFLLGGESREFPPTPCDARPKIPLSRWGGEPQVVLPSAGNEGTKYHWSFLAVVFTILIRLII